MLCSVNWNTFKAKFGEASEEVFEYLSYLVFCRKYGLKFGIAGYRNHPGLEKKSIKVGDEHIGFQAKFFLEKFADKKDDIKKAILDAKKHHPEITVLMFFMPMDHDSSPKKKGNDKATKAQIEVEEAASTVGLKTIKWFCHSEFIRTMAEESNSYWAAHFFGPGDDIFTFIHSINDKTRLILDVAKNNISANGYNVSIDRTVEIQKIRDCESATVVAIVGEGGVGKTALVKTLVENPKDGCGYVLRPKDLLSFFDPGAMASAWHIRIADFMDVHGDCSEKILVVDDVWKVSDETQIEDLVSILNSFLKEGWKTVLTLRPMYKSSLDAVLQATLERQICWIELPALADEQLNDIAVNNQFTLPADPLTRDLLRIPFYLNEYLLLPKEGRGRGLKRFKEVLWQKRVQGNDPLDTASNTFIDLVATKIQDNSYWLDIAHADRSDLKKLSERGILAKDEAENAFLITHDIYEEWALEKNIERQYQGRDTRTFLNELKDTYSNHRAYRLWLQDKIVEDDFRVKEIIKIVMLDFNNTWCEDTILAILASGYGFDFLKEHKDVLFAGNGKLIKQIVDWVRLSCRAERNWSINANLAKRYKIEPVIFKLANTFPVGNAWHTLMLFLYENKNDLPLSNQDEIIRFVYDWCSVTHEGDTTKFAARLALEIALRNVGTDWRTHLVSHDCQTLLFKTLSNGVREIGPELGKCIESYLAMADDEFRVFPADFCHEIVAQSIEYVLFIQTCPDLTRKILNQLIITKPRWGSYGSWAEAERRMGITDAFRHDCDSLSAFQTPVYWLLHSDFWPTIKLWIELVNRLVEKWSESDSNTTKTAFVLGNGIKCEQYISNVLWCANRGVGTPALPKIFSSMHMAFEKVLFDFDSNIKDDDQKTVDAFIQICLQIISLSKSASITGAISSLVLKNPNRYYPLGEVILSSAAAILCDMWRAQTGENFCNMEYSLVSHKDLIYGEERLETLKQDFRRTSLQDQIIRYQCDQGKDCEDRKKKMQGILNEFEKSDDPLTCRMCDCLDVRKMKLVTLTGKNGETIQGWQVQDAGERRAVSDAEKRATSASGVVMTMNIWAESKFMRMQMSDSARAYENNPEKLIADAKLAFWEYQNGNEDFFIATGAPSIAAALLFFQAEALNEEMHRQCADIVLGKANKILHESYLYQVLNHCECVLAALPLLCTDVDSTIANQAWRLVPIAMLCEARCSSARACDYVFNSIRKLTDEDEGLMHRFVGLYQKVRREYDAFLADPQSRALMIETNKDLLQCFIDTHPNSLLQNNEEINFKVSDILLANDSVILLRNTTLMIPEKLAVTDKDSNTIVIEGIEVVMNDIYRLDEDGQLNKDYLGDEADVYQRRLAEIMMTVGERNLLVIIEHLKRVPLAFSENWFLLDIIRAANSAGARDRFWLIWRGIKPIMKELVTGIGSKYFHQHVEQALETYFLGNSVWRGNPEDCKVFQITDLGFWDELMSDFGASIPTIYALQSFLGSLGLQYWRDGIVLLSKQIAALPTDYYYSGFAERAFINVCERYMAKVVSENQETVKRHAQLKFAAKTIVDFLVKRKSQIAHALRDKLT